jgi:hypothetical protein
MPPWLDKFFHARTRLISKPRTQAADQFFIHWKTDTAIGVMQVNCERSDDNRDLD